MRSVLVLSLLLVAACGRKATPADCELIIDRNLTAQLKHQGTTDPKLIEQEKTKNAAFLKQKVDECVGKRITDGMLACVKTAETTEQIDKCLR